MRALKTKAGNVEIIPEGLVGSYRHAIPEIDAMIQKYKPDAFISMGMALRREVISLEKVAINYQNDNNYDNKQFFSYRDPYGYTAAGKYLPVVEGAPDGYFTNLPIVKMFEALKKAEFPSEISLTAGAVGCNNAMYSILYLINTKYPSMLGGFIHIPGHHEHPGRRVKTFSVEYIAQGIETAVSVLGE
jgi:pyroglutamyl-peptidase